MKAASPAAITSSSSRICGFTAVDVANANRTNIPVE